MGYRVKKEDGTFGQYVWSTYNEVAQRVTNFASGLVHLQLIQKNADGLPLIAHFSKNRMENHELSGLLSIQGLEGKVLPGN